MNKFHESLFIISTLQAGAVWLGENSKIPTFQSIFHPSPTNSYLTWCFFMNEKRKYLYMLNLFFLLFRAALPQLEGFQTSSFIICVLFSLSSSRHVYIHPHRRKGFISCKKEKKKNSIPLHLGIKVYLRRRFGKIFYYGNFFVDIFRLKRQVEW